MARAVVAAVATLLATWGGVAAADRTKNAGEHFERGEKAQAEGRYRDAISSYLQAHAFVPHPNNLFNVAVCYERLGEWSSSADYYEKYLDLDRGAADASSVKGKIRALRAKAGDPGPPVEPLPQPYPGPGLGTGPGGTGGGPGPGPIDGTPGGAPVPPPRWHAGISYGLGFGDAMAERYLAHGGIRIAKRIDFDGVIGLFGKNDLAIGVAARLVLARSGLMTYIARGGATIGYAKQDDSSDAGTRAPLGFEAGAGLQFGARARFELSAVLRWTVGGWDAASTTADSYINDTMAFAIDFGFALDFPIVAGGKPFGSLTASAR